MSSSEDPRLRLLEAAGQVFAEKGFDGATVRDICRRAGANIAAVNYYFRDKERLYIEAVKGASCGSLEDSPLLTWPSGTAPEIKLRDFIRERAVQMLRPDKPDWHTQLMMREMAHPTSACAEWVRDYVRPHSEQLGDILGELMPPGTPAFSRFLTGFSIMGQCLFYIHCKPVAQALMGDEYRRITAEAVADHVTAFSLAALGVKTPRPKAARAARGQS
jgi:TetR/AcrR family transcriptional regulator, regulator of cefoperazone and chloramphenicol sensitivity